MSLPDIVPKANLTHFWPYRDQCSEIFALVARYDIPGKKKWFHQYQLIDGVWTEGAATPLPIFGLHTLQNLNPDKKVFIFEGEKCAEAAHYLDLAALTSMGGSSQCAKADWAVLAQFRQYHRFVLVPDHDDAGKKYMREVYDEIRKACPQAEITVCVLSLQEKGADFVDWLQSQPACPENWNGFQSIDEPASLYLRQAFEKAVAEFSVSAEEYFVSVPQKPVFSGPFEPMSEEIPKVKECPSHIFPDEVRCWIEEHGQLMQVPLDYLVIPLIIYMGTVIGRKRGVQVRQGWTEFPNLWGMLIGNPALMKSPAMKAMQMPLKQLIERGQKKFYESNAIYTKDLKKWNLLKKGQEDACKQNLQKKLPAGISSLNDIADFSIPPEPIRPILKRYRTDDATIQKIGELLIENPQGLLLFRDELPGWLSGFQKKGREDERQFFLESWNGNQDFYVDRIGRGSIYIPALCMSILGSIQPDPLKRYVQAAVQGGSDNDGFIQRFQLMVWPEVTRAWQLLSITPSKEYTERVIRIFDYLDKLTFEEDKPVLLPFSSAAQEAFDQWQYTLENRLRSGELPPYLQAHLAKYKKLVPALGLILELLRSGYEEKTSYTIRESALEGALFLADYLESHAIKVYTSGNSTKVLERAKTLIRMIKAGKINVPFRARDVYQGHHWSGLKDVKEVQEVLDYLCDRNYLATEVFKTPGRSTTQYWVNPAVFTC